MNRCILRASPFSDCGGVSSAVRFPNHHSSQEAIMVDYTIAAIPTAYNGLTYRSRLEARWAAFFDMMGWQAEYEPYDLGKWSPDFLLKAFSSTWLVEIKPVNNFDVDTATRMSAAVDSHVIAPPFGGILLCGVSPILLGGGKAVQIGWESHCRSGRQQKWWPSVCAWWINPDWPDRPMPGFAPEPLLDIQQDEFRFYPDYLMDRWKAASSLVQWKPT